MDTFALDEERYIALLSRLIGEAKYLQNSPPKFIPTEDKAIAHILEVLSPYSVENGGTLQIKHITYIAGRGNLIVKYAPETAVGSVAFAGSHLDVVPANPADWTVDPFTLSREGDKLFGRGTTDCLGHVALLTEFFLQLAVKKPALKVAVTAVLIASEENSSIPEVGVDMLMKNGHLDDIKRGPVFWVDSADSQPCIGTAAAIQWKLRVDGKLFHSGLPHKGINAFELGSEAIAIVQRRFFEDFPAHSEEGPDRYGFASPSTMKPTRMEMGENSVNQLPAWVEIAGDIRLTPFYSVEECMNKVSLYIADLNANLSAIPTRGPCSKYEVVEESGSTTKGKLTLTWTDAPFRGIACKLDSPGFECLCAAHKTVKGQVKPYSITGSLPLVGDMQDAGYDIQVCGYGKSSVYHGTNEYVCLSDMVDAFKIFALIVSNLDAKF